MNLLVNNISFKNNIPKLIESNINEIQKNYSNLIFNINNNNKIINLFSNNIIEIPKGIPGKCFSLLSSNHFISNEKIEINIIELSNLFNLNQYTNKREFIYLKDKLIYFSNIYDEISLDKIDNFPTIKLNFSNFSDKISLDKIDNFPTIIYNFNLDDKISLDKIDNFPTIKSNFSNFDPISLDKINNFPTIIYNFSNFDPDDKISLDKIDNFPYTDIDINIDNIYNINYINNNHHILKFNYDTTNDINGQSEYIINFNKEIECDILIVGGGGGGGGTHSVNDGVGGGGGAGGLVFLPNYKLNGNYKIKVGKGGNGNWNIGIDGTTSSIEKHDGIGVEGIDNFQALGGGGGGDGKQVNTNIATNGNPGGSGGGGGGNSRTNGGESTQNLYNGKGFGNNGGSSTSAYGDQSAGGGGAGGQGQHSYHYRGQNVGGEGGIGLHKVTINGIEYKFKDLFGTNVGEYIENSSTIRDLNTTAGDYFNKYYEDGKNTSEDPIPIVEEGIYFAGGGAGSIDRSTYGNLTLGGLGGGGSVFFDIEKTNGIDGTGGGGAGCGKNHHTHGSNGGNGIVLIRCKNNIIKSDFSHFNDKISLDKIDNFPLKLYFSNFNPNDKISLDKIDNFPIIKSNFFDFSDKISLDKIDNFPLKLNFSNFNDKISLDKIDNFPTIKLYFSNFSDKISLDKIDNFPIIKSNFSNFSDKISFDKIDNFPLKLYFSNFSDKINLNKINNFPYNYIDIDIDIEIDNIFNYIYNINDTYSILKFNYDINNNNDGQTKYIINFNKETECDILIVGGGGSGGGSGVTDITRGGTGGGGGAGGLVFLPNHKLNGYYKIKIGRGGLGTIYDGENGKDSSIEKNDGFGTEGIDNFIALGGGGGGLSLSKNTKLVDGKIGGSGGGGGGYGKNTGRNGGQSTQKLYNGKGFGNKGGNTLTESAGGGGAGGEGQNSYLSSNPNPGGEGGIGLHKVTINGIEYKFKDLFGTNVAEYIENSSTIRNIGTVQDYFNKYYEDGTNTSEVPIPIVEEGIYFAGGGAGSIDISNSDNLTLGGLGGGGSVKFNEQITDGIDGTGGGGAGCGKNHRTSGSDGGNGIVLIRCKNNIIKSDFSHFNDKISLDKIYNFPIIKLYFSNFNPNDKISFDKIDNFPIIKSNFSNFDFGDKISFDKIDNFPIIKSNFSNFSDKISFDKIDNFPLKLYFSNFSDKISLDKINNFPNNYIDIDIDIEIDNIFNYIYNINDTYSILKFNYDIYNNNDGQTEYIICFNKDTECDILIVGGGGGGGGSTNIYSGCGGGGGAGGLVFLPNHKLNGDYKIKIGKGGIGTNGTGDNGITSLIEKNNNGVEGIDNFYALGGGGGGNGRISEYQSGPGNSGGSGGGRGGNIRFSNEDANQALTSQNLYNGKGFGNNGGTTTYARSQSGGGGGAGGEGQNSYFAYNKGGEGGIGLHKVNINGTEYKFKDLFGTNVGEYIENSSTIRDIGTAQNYFDLYYNPDINSFGYYDHEEVGNTEQIPIPNIEEGIYFAGGGAGAGDRVGLALGGETLGGLGGGGSVNISFNDIEKKITDGIDDTGGGGSGSGAFHRESGSKGGNGIVLIRCKNNIFKQNFFNFNKDKISLDKIDNFPRIISNFFDFSDKISLDKIDNFPTIKSYFSNFDPISLDKIDNFPIDNIKFNFSNFNPDDKISFDKIDNFPIIKLNFSDFDSGDKISLNKIDKFPIIKFNFSNFNHDDKISFDKIDNFYLIEINNSKILNTANYIQNNTHYILNFYYDTNNNNNNKTNYTVYFPEKTLCDILIVGGGGGGSGDVDGAGGGGGGGGVILAESIILNGIYNIKVGNGGDLGDTSLNKIATNGEYSEFEGIIAYGGGAGSELHGKNGGSGGGGYYTGGISIQSKDKTNYGFLYNLTNNGERLNIYGENGGTSGGNDHGGGGAGSPGKHIGGDSINLSHIFGNTVGENGYFAGGGAGRGTWGSGDNGKPNTGNGGGGAGNSSVNYNTMIRSGGGGRGGSGIVLIKLNSTKLYFNQFPDDKISFNKIDNFPLKLYFSNFSDKISLDKISNFPLNFKFNFSNFDSGDKISLDKIDNFPTIKLNFSDFNISDKISLDKIDNFPIIKSNFSNFNPNDKISLDKIDNFPLKLYFSNFDPDDKISLDKIDNFPYIDIDIEIDNIFNYIYNINDTYSILKFNYDPNNDNNGQSEYIINFNKEIECDILIIGGGGGGGGGSVYYNDGVGGGGGAGGLVFLPNHKLNGDYKIKIGKGGIGKYGTGENGITSLIEKNDGTGFEGIDNFIANGGGGGGRGRLSNTISGPGNPGGSGGGGGGNSITNGGESTQNLYNGKGFGNNGGSSTSAYGDQSAGGGGAGGQGQNSYHYTGQNVGGEGGIGLHKVTINGIEYKFKDLFGTNVGEYIENSSTIRDVGTAQDYFNKYYEDGRNTTENPIPIVEEGIYFAGGGAGSTDRSTYGNLTLGGLGGGGSVKFNEQITDGIDGTGGGGAGCGKGHITYGSDGGNGIVLIRYKNNIIKSDFSHFNDKISLDKIDNFPIIKLYFSNFNPNDKISLDKIDNFPINNIKLNFSNFDSGDKISLDKIDNFSLKLNFSNFDPISLDKIDNFPIDKIKLYFSNFYPISLDKINNVPYNYIDIDIEIDYIFNYIYNINDTYSILKFNYDTNNDNNDGQSEYIINFNKEIECDILIIGGGGGGGGSTNPYGGYGGGGGAGGLVFLPNHKLNGDYKIKIGKGGIGTNGIGDNGKTSSIEKNINGIEGIDNFYALGGGGGGNGKIANNISGPGNSGGNGGGAGGNYNSSIINGGQSTQNLYNGKGFGNNGGNTTSIYSSSSGGGGGAGGEGQNSYITYNRGGGEGGIGLHKVNINGIEYKFKDLFGTNVGEYIQSSLTTRDLGTAQNYFDLYYNPDINQWFYSEEATGNPESEEVIGNTAQDPIPTVEEGIYFAGGGAGCIIKSNTGLTLGGLGGGGSINAVYDDIERKITDGIDGTGGGGAGDGSIRAFGSKGGNGIILIRCKNNIFKQNFFHFNNKINLDKIDNFPTIKLNFFDFNPNDKISLDKIDNFPLKLNFSNFDSDDKISLDKIDNFPTIKLNFSNFDSDDKISLDKIDNFPIDNIKLNFSNFDPISLDKIYNFPTIKLNFSDFNPISLNKIDNFPTIKLNFSDFNPNDKIRLDKIDNFPIDNIKLNFSDFNIYYSNINIKYSKDSIENEYNVMSENNIVINNLIFQTENEDFSSASGDTKNIMNNFNSKLFNNGQTGEDSGQIGGSHNNIENKHTGVKLSTPLTYNYYLHGIGYADYGAFDSSSIGKNKYFLFDGNNYSGNDHDRYLKTKNISVILSTCISITFRYIVGNDHNGGNRVSSVTYYHLYFEFLSYNGNIVSQYRLYNTNDNFTLYKHILTQQEKLCYYVRWIQYTYDYHSTNYSFDHYGLADIKFNYYATTQHQLNNNKLYFNLNIKNEYLCNVINSEFIKILNNVNEPNIKFEGDTLNAIRPEDDIDDYINNIIITSDIILKFNSNLSNIQSNIFDLTNKYIDNPPDYDPGTEYGYRYKFDIYNKFYIVRFSSLSYFDNIYDYPFLVFFYDENEYNNKDEILTIDEDFKIASGSTNTLMFGLNSKLFNYGKTGEDSDQIGGSYYDYKSGIVSSSDVFDSLTSTEKIRYFQFNGNTDTIYGIKYNRFLKTKNISDILSKCITITFMYVVGTHEYAGVYPKEDETLYFEFLDQYGLIQSMNIIHEGGTHYDSGSNFTLYTHPLTENEQQCYYVRWIQKYSEIDNSVHYGITDIKFNYIDINKYYINRCINIGNYSYDKFGNGIHERIFHETYSLNGEWISNSLNGEWISIEFPYLFRLDKFEIKIYSNNLVGLPKKISIYGKNNTTKELYNLVNNTIIYYTTTIDKTISGLLNINTLSRSSSSFNFISESDNDFIFNTYIIFISEVHTSESTTDNINLKLSAINFYGKKNYSSSNITLNLIEEKNLDYMYYKFEINYKNFKNPNYDILYSNFNIYNIRNKFNNLMIWYPLNNNFEEYSLNSLNYLNVERYIYFNSNIKFSEEGIYLNTNQDYLTINNNVFSNLFNLKNINKKIFNGYTLSFWFKINDNANKTIDLISATDIYSNIYNIKYIKTPHHYFDSIITIQWNFTIINPYNDNIYVQNSINRIYSNISPDFNYFNNWVYISAKLSIISSNINYYKYSLYLYINNEINYFENNLSLYFSNVTYEDGNFTLYNSNILENYLKNTELNIGITKNELLNIYIKDIRIYNIPLHYKDILDIKNLNIIRYYDLHPNYDLYYTYVLDNENLKTNDDEEIFYFKIASSYYDNTYYYNINFNFEITCDVLIIGGGGGGGLGRYIYNNDKTNSYSCVGGGGGGAGGLVFCDTIKLYGDIIIKVGKGGKGSSLREKRGDNGYDSSINIKYNSTTYTAIGGGGGGSSSLYDPNSEFTPQKTLFLDNYRYDSRDAAPQHHIGGNGGSGGGGIYKGISTQEQYYKNIYIAGTDGYSHEDEYQYSDINTFFNKQNCGGGGGGSSINRATEVNGGTGITNISTGKYFVDIFNITDISIGHHIENEVYFVGGGGSANTNNIKNTGGKGGGGNGGYFNQYSNILGTNGQNNSGGGGGGSIFDYSSSYECKGGDGGSGIVIIRYKKINFINNTYLKYDINININKWFAIPLTFITLENLIQKNIVYYKDEIVPRRLLGSKRDFLKFYNELPVQKSINQIQHCNFYDYAIYNGNGNNNNYWIDEISTFKPISTNFSVSLIITNPRNYVKIEAILHICATKYTNYEISLYCSKNNNTWEPVFKETDKNENILLNNMYSESHEWEYNKPIKGFDSLTYYNPDSNDFETVTFETTTYDKMETTSLETKNIKIQYTHYPNCTGLVRYCLFWKYNLNIIYRYFQQLSLNSFKYYEDNNINNNEITSNYYTNISKIEYYEPDYYNKYNNPSEPKNTISSITVKEIYVEQPIIDKNSKAISNLLTCNIDDIYYFGKYLSIDNEEPKLYIIYLYDIAYETIYIGDKREYEYYLNVMYYSDRNTEQQNIVNLGVTKLEEMVFNHNDKIKFNASLYYREFFKYHSDYYGDGGIEGDGLLYRFKFRRFYYNDPRTEYDIEQLTNAEIDGSFDNLNNYFNNATRYLGYTGDNEDMADESDEFILDSRYRYFIFLSHRVLSQSGVLYDSYIYKLEINGGIATSVNIDLSDYYFSTTREIPFDNLALNYTILYNINYSIYYEKKKKASVVQEIGNFFYKTINPVYGHTEINEFVKYINPSYYVAERKIDYYIEKDKDSIQLYSFDEFKIENIYYRMREQHDMDFIYKLVDIRQIYFNDVDAGANNYPNNEIIMEEIDKFNSNIDSLINNGEYKLSMGKLKIKDGYQSDALSENIIEFPKAVTYYTNDKLVFRVYGKVFNYGRKIRNMFTKNNELKKFKENSDFIFEDGSHLFYGNPSIFADRKLLIKYFNGTSTNIYELCGPSHIKTFNNKTYDYIDNDLVNTVTIQLNNNENQSIKFYIKREQPNHNDFNNVVQEINNFNTNQDTTWYSNDEINPWIKEYEEKWDREFKEDAIRYEYPPLDNNLLNQEDVLEINIEPRIIIIKRPPFMYKSSKRRAAFIKSDKEIYNNLRRRTTTDTNLLTTVEEELELNNINNLNYNNRKEYYFNKKDIDDVIGL